MSAVFDSLNNRGEYFSAHYFADQLAADLKKGVFAKWAQREGDENDPRPSPRQQIRTLRSVYFSSDVRGYFVAADKAEADAAESGTDLVVPGLFTFRDDEWRKRLAAWHQDVLLALGYDAAPVDLLVHRAGRDHTIPVAFHGDGIVAIDCGWADDTDGALNPDNADRLHSPLQVTASERYETGAALASWLFQSQLGSSTGTAPRFVLLLHGGVIILADRNAWPEGRYLAVNLDAALERYDRAQYGELSTIAALFSVDMLGPGDNDRAPAMDALLKASSTNAVGVSKELRHGLQRSVEIISNEVLRRMAEPRNGVTPADIEDAKIPFAKELARESLRYLYRILFLLYAEARPELGILPGDDGSYEAGYSMARLRELVARDEEIVEEEAKNGFHLYLSLDVLFKKVNEGHRQYGTEPDDDQPDDDEQTRRQKAKRRSEDQGLRFEALHSKLFEQSSIRLIGENVPDPREDDRIGSRRLDLRLRNVALHEVLRLLTMKSASGGERGGFISYRNLGINQLGAVYEGLMSYTGIIASEELCEVARDGDPEQGSWLIESRRLDQYPDKVLVHYGEDEARKGKRGVKKYDKGTFVYRLAGRDRETSASYYTPDSLTKVTVELALKQALDQERNDNGEVILTRAAELLAYKICEPALGSGAFLNEAINQVAEEYLRRRQDEVKQSISGDVLTEKQKVKAYIALHNCYGVDLNDSGVELAEVSLWLNTMHPGMRAPWFGLHLRHGNSLIGARRAVYSAEDVCSPAKAWLKAKGGLAPNVLPFLNDGQPQDLPDGAVHQFLLPNPGWAAVAGSSEAKKLAPELTEQLSAWRKGILQRPSRSNAHLNADGTPKLNTRKEPRKEAVSQYTRLRDVARRAEFLWSLVVKRMEISEREIARRIDVWEADPADPEYAFLQRPERPVPKEQVQADLFDAVDTPYWRLKMVMDAWCALWFWPAADVAVLDGTEDRYASTMEVLDADSLADRLGTATASKPLAVDEAPSGESDDASQPTSDDAIRAIAPVSAPAYFRRMALFPVDGEQMAFDDVDWVNESAVEVRKDQTTVRKSPKPRPALRPVIPLKDLDDWLDFLEAMLGRADLLEGTLIESLDSLDKLRHFEEMLPKPGHMDMDTTNPEVRFPWLHVVREIAAKQAFLHWELEFALIFASNGGFDLQVGNPPWVRPRWDADGVLAEHEPWFKLEEQPAETEKIRRRDELLSSAPIKEYFTDELTTNSAQVGLFGSPQVYPLLAGTQPDLYRAFMCQVWAHASASGTIGLLHPDTHFAGEKEGALREEAYGRLRIHGDFVNSGQRFFPEPVGHTAHFGVHIYGQLGNIGFDHLSWLVSADALRLSRNHDGSGEIPGIRFQNREFDERPHRTRVIRVDEETLAVWRRLLDDEDKPLTQARLLFPVSTAEADAIEALAAHPLRLTVLGPQISPGFHESGAKKAHVIDYNRTGYQPASWDEVILKGVQLSTATPVFKRHDANSNDPCGADLGRLPPDFVPDTEYVRVGGGAEVHDRWVDYVQLARLRADEGAVSRARESVAHATGVPAAEVDADKVDALLVEESRRPCVDFYRLAWRRQVAPNTERALYAALIPPGPAHIDAVHSLVMPTSRLTALVGGFWASLPLDYFLRATGRGDLRVAGAKALPAPAVDHPLASALLLRTLRLNCLTVAYADLWAELYDPSWLDSESWAYDWSGVPPLNDVTPDWRPETPLRTERIRRSALIEIDALAAVWLGLSANALIAAYQGRFPVLQKFEAATWFDGQGSKLASNARTFGQRQTKQAWSQFEAHQKDPEHVPPPDGYLPPFYKADRETEMRAAHAVFQARLEAAS